MQTSNVAPPHTSALQKPMLSIFSRMGIMSSVFIRVASSDCCPSRKSTLQIRRGPLIIGLMSWSSPGFRPCHSLFAHQWFDPAFLVQVHDEFTGRITLVGHTGRQVTYGAFFQIDFDISAFLC